MGLLNNLRSFLWIRIQQFTTQEVEVELFKYISFLFYIKKKINKTTNLQYNLLFLDIYMD